MLFLSISKHAPEICPIHNEKHKKATMDLMANSDKLLKKHGVKQVGSWLSMPNHMLVSVYDAPNMEAMMKFSMEPVVVAWLAYNDSEMFPVTTAEEAVKMFLK
jgi:uncharacterized protein with GYD domain